MKALALLALVIVTAAIPFNADDLIENLPGLKQKSSFNQYSGYFNVNAEHGRNLFYWYVEAEHPKNDTPVTFWFTGGPGCSGLSALFGQNGPFAPDANGDLHPRSTSWNRVSHVVYLESPSGVGFSYSEDTSDYVVGDERTFDDAYRLIAQFLAKYNLQGHPVWINGESYGGHYVPGVTARIVRGNEEESAGINIQGMMVGNAWTVAERDNAGAVEYWFDHGLISEKTFDGLNKNCDYKSVGPLNDICDDLSDVAAQERGQIDIYDSFADVCLGTTEADYFISAISSAGSVVRPAKRNANEAPADVCVGNYFAKYLQRPDVIQAIHAHAPLGKWAMCSNLVQYNRTDLLSSMLPTYEYLFTKNLRLLVYSGDVDAIVPFTGTRLWLRDLNMDVVEPHRPWLAPNGQVAGYTVRYANLTYATVRGAGHMVFATQPDRGFALYTRFMNDEKL